jgi:hypothetical protein
VRTWLILFALCAVARSHGQRVEVPIQARTTVRPTIELSHIRGYLADPTWARIPKARIVLQKKKGVVLGDVQSIGSNQLGEFDFGKKPPGSYRLIVRTRGFCEITIPIKLSGNGWPGLRIALPLGATDTPSGYCDEQLKIERLGK